MALQGKIYGFDFGVNWPFKVHMWNQKKKQCIPRRENAYLFHFFFPKATGEQLIWLHRSSCLRVVGWEGERDRGWRQRRDEESETQRQFGLIMLIFFPSSAKQKHPGTFRHTTGDQSLLSPSFSPHRVSLEANLIFFSSLQEPVCPQPLSLYIFLMESNWIKS